MALNTRFRNGTLPRSLHPYFYHGNVHSSYKDRPRYDKADPRFDPDLLATRPRTTLSTYRRISGLCSQAGLKENIQNATKGNEQHRQYGSTPDGPAKCKHAISEELRAGRTVLSMDIKEAFTRIQRAYVLNVLLKARELVNTHRHVYFSYHNKNTLYIRGRNQEILASFPMPDGLHQGDVPSSWLYDLAYTTYLISVSINPTVRTYLCHDDTHVTGPDLNTTFEALGILSKALVIIGQEYVFCFLQERPPRLHSGQPAAVHPGKGGRSWHASSPQHLQDQWLLPQPRQSLLP